MQEVTHWTDSAWTLTSLYAPGLVTALAIFLIGRWVARRVGGVVEMVMIRGRVDPILIGFIKNLAYYALLVVVTLSALAQLGINTTSFLAILGTAGLAVGLAVKDYLSNFAAGVMLLFRRPFNLGDVVEAGGVTGKVQEMSIFETVLHTGDNRRIIQPNSKVMGTTIINLTANPERRIDLVIGIGYEDDIPKAKVILEKILAAEARVLENPAPTIGVSELADSSVNLVVRPWVKTSDYWPTKFALLETIKVAFDKEGVSFPYPQQDVHMISKN